MPNVFRARSVAAVLIASIALPAMADTFNARRNMQVNQVDANVFEVFGRRASSGPEYWCGAADYARRVLGAGWQDRVYIARGIAQGVTTDRRSTVHFTLDPAAAGVAPTDSSLSLNSMRPGDNMSVQQANTYCNMPPARF